MTRPKISIVIPSFNAEATIERTLQSLVAQEYPNLELILMDGASKDRTTEIARKYQKHFTRFVSEPDKGQADAINKGFALATGEIFGWLCADDELCPQALHHVADMFADNPKATLLTGGCTRLFPDNIVVNTEPQPWFWDKIGFHNGIEQPSTFWKASLHHAAGKVPENYHLAFDWAWWNELRRAGAKPITTRQILSRYHFSDTNKTSTGGRKTAIEMYRVIKRYGPLKGYLADIYMFLYRHFDLYGYYDRPAPAQRNIRGWFFKRTLKLLIRLFGTDLIYGYNWNFASKQERNLCWYK